MAAGNPVTCYPGPAVAGVPPTRTLLESLPMSVPPIRLSLVLPLVALGVARAAEPSSTAFIGVTVIDVTAGKAVPDQTVVVADGKITAVGPAGTVRVPSGATELKAAGKFLIPGLWDMHTHIADETYCELFLANGITGVREMHAFFPA